MSSLPANISRSTLFQGIRLSTMQDGLPDFDIATPIEPDEVTWADWSKANPQPALVFDREHFDAHATALLLSLQDSTLVRPLGIDEIARYYSVAASVSSGEQTPDYFRAFIEQDRRWIHEDTADLVSKALRYWDVCRERHAEGTADTN